MALPCGAMGCLRFVIVVFPDHTHLLSLIEFSLDISLTKSTLDDFGRLSNIIYATPRKLSGI